MRRRISWAPWSLKSWSSDWISSNARRTAEGDEGESQAVALRLRSEDDEWESIKFLNQNKKKKKKKEVG